jgi:hypothetical protein
MMKKLIPFILISLTFVSCKRLEPQPKESTVFVPFLSSSSLYLRDNTEGFESKSIFETLKWYTYDFAGGHIIWSNLDIYTVNTGRETYYFQIEDFYDPARPPAPQLPENFAQITLNVKSHGQLTQLNLDGYACGIQFLDPAGFARCQADPERNQFTYLNLSNLQSWKMTDAEAEKRTDWHVAFKDFEIKINNGINGPGRNLAGLAYRNEKFFKKSGGEIVPILPSIKSAKIGGEALSYFDLMTSNVRYYLPKGHERVMNESDWYKEDSLGNKQAVENIWIVKSIEGNSFFKISVDEIIDNEKLVFAYNYQAPQTQSFNIQTFTYEFPTLEEGQAQEYCVDLDKSELGCDNSNWDLKLETKADGTWLLWTHNGAFPVADKQLALGLNSAL